jgi:hypothetical protein
MAACRLLVPTAELASEPPLGRWLVREAVRHNAVGRHPLSRPQAWAGSGSTEAHPAAREAWHRGRYYSSICSPSSRSQQMRSVEGAVQRQVVLSRKRDSCLLRTPSGSTPSDWKAGSGNRTIAIWVSVRFYARCRPRDTTQPAKKPASSRPSLGANKHSTPANRARGRI